MGRSVKSAAVGPPRGRVRVHVGGELGGSVFWQWLPGGERRHSPGGAVALAAGLTWIPADPLVLSLGFRAGVEAQREDGALTWAPLVGAGAGLGGRV